MDTTTKATTKNSAPDKEQIEAWKKEHKTIFKLDVQGREAYVRKPKLLDLELAMKAHNKSSAKALDYNRIIVQRCQLWVDSEIFDGDELEVALYTAVGELAAIKDAEITKL